MVAGMARLRKGATITSGRNAATGPAARTGRKADATDAYRQYLQVQQDGDWVERVRRILEMLGEQVEG